MASRLDDGWRLWPLGWWGAIQVLVVGPGTILTVLLLTATALLGGPQALVRSYYERLMEQAAAGVAPEPGHIMAYACVADRPPLQLMQDSVMNMPCPETLRSVDLETTVAKETLRWVSAYGVMAVFSALLLLWLRVWAIVRVEEAGGVDGASR